MSLLMLQDAKALRAMQMHSVRQRPCTLTSSSPQGSVNPLYFGLDLLSSLCSVVVTGGMLCPTQEKGTCVQL
eukprot:1841360-Amphidinium_carterae.1